MALDARLFPHLANLRYAQLGVGSEKQLPCIDGEVVLFPVPEILELLVVKRREGVHAGGERREWRNGLTVHSVLLGTA